MIQEKGVVVHPNEITSSWLNTIFQSDINLIGLHPVGGETAHLSLLRLVENGHSSEEKENLNKLKAAGIGIEYEAHAMSYLLPREEFARHPEWFRMDENGNRTNDFNCCATNQEALDVISESAYRLAKFLPSTTHRYNLWLDDVPEKRCHCKECAKYGESDQAMILSNAILKGLKRADKLAKQSYLGYYGTSTPPKLVTPDDGIFLEYAPFQRDFHKPLTDECNLRPATNAKDLIEFFGKDNAKVLDYWLDNSLYSGWKKPPKRFVLDAEVCKKDLEFYDRLGYSVITTFACYLGADYEELYGFPDLKGYI